MRSRTAIVVAAIAAQVAVSLVQFGLPSLSFALHDERGIGPAGFGLLFGATGAGAALSLFAVGRLADRLGERPVLIAGTLLGVAGLLAAGAASTLWPTALALVIAGAGTAAAPVAGMTALISRFPPTSRGLVMGLRQMAVPAGGALAALVLPPVARVHGLQAAFDCAAAAVLITGLAFAVVIGPRPARQPRPAAQRPSGPIQGLRRLMLVGVLYVTVLAGVTAFIAPAAVHAGMPQRTAELLLATLNVAAAVARIVWGRIADRGGGTRRVRSLVDVGLLAAASMLVLPAALALGPGAAFPVTVAVAFGALGFNGLVYVLAGELGAPDRSGAAVGAASTAVFGGSAIAAPLAGIAVDAFGYSATFIALAGVAAAGALAARGLAAAARSASQAA